MKRKLALWPALILTLGTIFTLSSCGNMQIIDTTYTFDYALVRFPDGDTKKIEIESWSDYDGEQIQIRSTDGKTYLVNSVNCILVSE